ncbi:methyl-accepting chemotaxis protein [Alteromonas sp. ASW11-19]|uniref:Methyl-accepting chemotaxis protein n=1 Tax=Alteromonas salexigens TaxID=2982530 RepID=A0ABT2VLQ6_9ALTE|nr:methyl-accepting chemotaxis protein [Alteromonas salexigens]MCU7553363.1 methyl-accepting chemotaxis protein [Alteromonas salexigens]
MNFRSLSIKQKLISALIVAVIASTVLVGSISQWIARDLITENLEEMQLPAMVKQVGNRIDKEVSVMKTVAHSIATNPDVVAWSAAGANPAGERQLVQYLGDLVAFNDLTVASFVDRQTYKYWNQDGFLRVLKNDKADGWFFAYKDSGEPVSLSLYNEPGVGYRLFANYQQVNGRGMSGVAKSVDELVGILNDVRLATSGVIFMVDGQGRIIAHPDDSLVGDTTLDELAGRPATSSLLSKQSFTLEHSTEPGEDTLFASTYIASAGWYVVAEVPQAELYDELETASRHIVLWSVLVAVLFALLGIWLAGSITRPLERLADAFQALGKGQGDLSTRLPVPEQKETAKLVEGFNAFTDHLHGTISHVAETSKSLRESAGEVASQSRHTEQISQQQHDRTIHVASALTELGTTVSDVAGSATQAAQQASTATSTSQEGRQITGNAVAAISSLSEQISRVANVIQSLDDHTTAIGGILDTIRGISEQTNLLALNAAIEAARAGDHGRGFSVVADEVRSLAQRAADATDEIQTKMDKFQQDSQAAVQQMQTSRQQTDDVVAAASRIDELLQDVAASIADINDMNTQVAAATEQQSEVVNNVSETVHEISDNSKDTLARASALVTVSEQLDVLARDLARQVEQFRL